MSKRTFVTIATVLCFTVACDGKESAPEFQERAHVSEEDKVVEELETQLQSVETLQVPEKGWGAEDELGNANLLGEATTKRCALAMVPEKVKVYELGYPHSNTMPASPVSSHPFEMEPLPTWSLPFMAHVANEEVISGTLAHQGTQLDSLGHFGVMPEIWMGEGPIAVETATYYNGFTQAQVKPTPDSPLLKLGIEKVPPIVTSAVILDAKQWKGSSLEAGELITKDDILDIVASDADLSDRGILAGDAVYIRTGWGEKWMDPNPPTNDYYLQGPGLSVDAAEYLGKQGAVVVGLDNPFTDPAMFCNGMLCGSCEGGCSPAEGTLPGLPFGIHHHFLVEAGVLQIQNMNLKEIADDNVSVACTMVLPLRASGASGSPIRPIAIGR